jgi:Domain of unknown function (DUF362)
VRLPASATSGTRLQVSLLQDTEAVLAALRRRGRARPALERQGLWSLALEREQIVTVVYSEELVAARIERLPVPAEVRELVRHALVWAWKDEEAHATYLRGKLLAPGSLLPAAVVYGRQLYGALSGWVTGTSQYVSPSAAPLRAPLVRLLLYGARVTGRVPGALYEELRSHSFRRYCALNVGLELTAARCYQRLEELADDEDTRDTISRIEADEQRHGRMFGVLEATFADDDRLQPGQDAETLADGLRHVSEWFLPAPRRHRSRRSSFATGADVWVATSDAGADAGLRTELRRVLDAAGLGRLVAGRPGPVAIRTAFMLGYDRRDQSNVVSPTVLDALAEYVRSYGATEVAVLEAPTVYERFYRNRSVPEVAAALGYCSERYRIVDVSSDQVPFEFDRGIAQVSTCATWRDAAVRIVLPKMRTDPTEWGHLSLSTLEGMGERIDRTIYAAREVDFRAAAMMMLDALPPDFALIDAWGPVAVGPFGVMGCARPQVVNRLYAGPDALAVDWAALRDMGNEDPASAPIVRRARHWFGVSGVPAEVHGSPGPIGGFRHPRVNRWSGISARLAYPVYVYASREGELFVPAMDTVAFPPRRRPSMIVRFARWASRRMFGLHPPGR